MRISSLVSTNNQHKPIKMAATLSAKALEERRVSRPAHQVVVAGIPDDFSHRSSRRASKVVSFTINPFAANNGAMDNNHNSLSTQDIYSPTNSNNTSPISDSFGPTVQSDGVHVVDFGQMTTLKTARISCCRCQNVQSLFTPWSPERAVCEKCTSAFCAKCHLVRRRDSESAMGSIIQFDMRSRAIIPLDVKCIDGYWLCATCGRIGPLEEARLKRQGATVVADIQGLECQPCQQNMTSKFLTVAWMRRWKGFEDRKASQAFVPEERAFKENDEDESDEDLQPTSSRGSTYRNSIASLRRMSLKVGGEEGAMQKLRRVSTAFSIGSKRSSGLSTTSSTR